MSLQKKDGLCIAVVEDDLDTQEVLRFNLDLEGYRVRVFENGEEALESLLREPPDLLILDLMLPGMGGLDVARALRSEPHTKTVPILMLTARSAEEDVVRGLKIGADDYLTKPFRLRELMARIEGLLRRSGKLEQLLLKFGDLRIDFAAMKALRGEKEIHLTRKEFGLLRVLLEAAGKVVSRDELLTRVWGYEFFGDPRTVDVHVRRLRAKLGEGDRLIQTVKGIGYRLNPRVLSAD